ncbi:MAG: Gfo/Idh/MocA family oxidoreductase [Capsulimonadaceae bacterium]|nr:Gfo/Idh/MocA family oxidoreductase [Capsulimonadaceae bacterium]
MANSPVGLGVVGAGSIGIRAPLAHLSLPDVQDRVRLTAVCDPFPGRAVAAAAKYGVAHGYESYEELLADPAVDAVTLCSPISLHFDQGMAAIAAGKHVHFNKTMTVTTAEATALIDAAAKAGVKLVASPGQMIKAYNRRIRRLILDGAIGQLAWAHTGAAFGSYHERESVRAGNDVLSNINPAWYWRKPGGGPLYDMTVYGLHSLTGILGPAKRVTAMSGVAVKEREFAGTVYPCDAEDNTLMVLDFGSTLFAFVYGTFAGGLGDVTFFGSKGVIRGQSLNDQPFDYPGKDNPDIHPLGPHITAAHRIGEEHVFEDMMQFVDLIREDIPTVATPEHARHVIEIIEAGLAASETGKTQILTTTFAPPDGE